jgi:hypothetical protein
MLAKRDPAVMKVLLSWVTRRPIASLSHVGYLE